jgi:trigger factor
MSKDEEKSESVTIEEGAVQQTLQGRTLTAEVKVISIQATVVPELDDETAKELGYEDGATAMRESITADASKRIEEGARNQARANLLQKLIESHDFEVPDAMVEAQLQQLVQELRMQQTYQGADPRMIHFGDEQMVELRGRALFAVKGGLLLQSISDAESIEPAEEDIDATLQEIADSQGQTLEFIKAYFQNEGQLDELRHHVQEKKTLDWLLERANVTEVDPKVVSDDAEESDSAE